MLKSDGGTYLLSSFESIRSWVWLEEVRAENVKNSVIMLEGMFFSNLSAIVSVFPVPVGPMHNICKNTWIHNFRIVENWSQNDSDYL